MNKTSQWMRGRTMAAVACAALTLPMIGCGSGAPSGASRPPIDDSRPMGYSNAQTSYGAASAQPPRQGLSTGKKVMLLAGAAALYYMYRKNQEKKQAGQLNGQPQYYLSKNGRVYYRDNTGQAHWVTPPAQGIQVPYDEAQQYSQFQGYNNQSNGITDLSRFAPAGSMGAGSMGAGSMGGGY